MKTSYSQDGEDIWILDNLKPPIGTFCEVGAFDGIQSSNTLLFEQLGWKGLLVEADPYLAAKCLINRKAMVACCAAGTPKGFFNFAINPEDRGLSGFNRPGEIFRIMVMRLEDLIDLARLEIDLLSIDTEGSELGVWCSIGELRPRIVIMEYQTCDEPSQESHNAARMIADGYRLVHTTKHNQIFTR